MKLTRVTITGADDKVPHQALYDLSADFPFVEWGILMSKKRFGEPRYPSTRWLADFAYDLVKSSYHLCGEFSRRVMGGDPTMVPRGIKRMQLNGFGAYRLPCLLCAEGAPDVEFILQCSDLDAIDHADVLAHGRTNISTLWDISGGTGKDDWGFLPIRPRCGYAGGITEHNIIERIRLLLEPTVSAFDDAPFWIDLESGARTDNEFDLAKVRRILELAKPFVTA